MRPLFGSAPALTLAVLRIVVGGLMPLAPGFREGASDATSSFLPIRFRTGWW